MARYPSLDVQKYDYILQACITLFYEQGISNTSMQEIANKAGIAKGTIYLYFKNKEDLVQKVLSHCLELNAMAAKDGVEDLDRSSDKLKQRVKNMLFWSQDNPKEASIVRAFYKPVNIAGTENVPHSIFYEMNKQILQQGIERGEFKPLPLDLICSLFFSLVEGISYYVLNNCDVLRDEELLDRILDPLISGIQA